MVDKVTIKIKAGDGGDGLVHFHRERFLPKGGPDGGDGGKGGDVYFVADSNLLSLYDFNSQRYYKADNGGKGGGKKSSGKSAQDTIIKVPEGTLVYEISQKAGESENPEFSYKIVADLTKSGERFLVAKGGFGGKGNFRFRSSINQKPMQFTKGQLGEEKDILLELKYIADVGLIGLPNSGKTSLLNLLTSARAKISNYPFTTLVPNLGVMDYKVKVVIADIPGLIEGAAQGKGLGHEFLKHIERTKVLVHVIDGATLEGTTQNAELMEKYQIIRAELGKWSKNLLKKPEIVVINKVDLLGDQIRTISHSMWGHSAIWVSALTGWGLDTLKNTIIEMVQKTPNKPFDAGGDKAKNIFTIDNLKNRAMVFRKEKEVSEVEEVLGRRRNKRHG
jgi:GTP-binding protein